MVNLVLDSLEEFGEDRAELENEISDRLKQLVLDSFDPLKADLIFSDSDVEIPSWIDELIQDAGWRSVFYRLADLYPDCLFLNVIIQKIGKEGLNSELAGNAAKSASIKFDMYLRKKFSLLISVFVYL